jgi:ABC-type phosphate/phosphonate transport system substrate-binding protein
VDGSAVDSQVLALTVRARPELRCHLRVIDSLGPSSIQPFVASRRLPAAVRAAMRAALLEVASDPAAREVLDHGLVGGFAAVDTGT